MGPAAPVVCVYNPLQLLLVFILIAGGGAPNLKAKLLAYPSNFNIPVEILFETGQNPYQLLP